MPEKLYVINNHSYVLNIGEDQEEHVDHLMGIISDRLEPYSKRFSEYSETYLMLLLALEFADELDRAPESEGSAGAIDNEREKQLIRLASRADSLVKKAQEY